MSAEKLVTSRRESMAAELAELESLTRKLDALRARCHGMGDALHIPLLQAHQTLHSALSTLEPGGRLAKPVRASLPALEKLQKTRTVRFIGAPFCEGQNLDGADLGPTSLREAGLKDAAALLGWGWEDEGDLDFGALFHSLGYDVQEPHHHPVQLYREWAAEGGMQDNFSTWVRRRVGIDAGSLRRTVSHNRDMDGMAKAGGDVDISDRTSNGNGKSDAERYGVVNVSLIGAGVGLVHDAVVQAIKQSRFALTIGGDHSIAAGSICAMHRIYPDLGVIWIDAHADANTPRTSPSAHYHGMPAAHLLGWFEDPLPGFEWFTAGCLDENRLAYIGLRDIDAEEGRMLRASNVHVWTMRDVDKHGIAKVIEMALSAIDPNSRRPLHLSLDIDGVDPHFAPGTGTAARGGLSYREIHYICEELAETNRLVGMDLVEINPGLDAPPRDSKMHGDDPNLKACSPTVQLGVELCLSALGKRIM